MTDITEYGDIIINAYIDEWGKRRINGLLEDGTKIIVAVALILKQWSQTCKTTHILLQHKMFKLAQTLKTLHQWTLPIPVFIKTWVATLQATHVFRRPFRGFKLSQTLNTMHVYFSHKIFRLAQTLRTAYVFGRPIRMTMFPATLQLTHIFGRPNRIVRLPASLQVNHFYGVPLHFIRFLERLGLAHTVYLAIPGVKKTRLFLVIGDLAIQITGD